MPILVQCTQCRQEGEVSRSAAGHTVVCAACQQPFKVPAGAGDVSVEWGAGAAGRRVCLTPGREVRIGRAGDNELVLPGGQVSRYHARIEWIDGEWMLADLDSANGVFVEGKRLKTAALADGMHVAIGEFTLRVTLGRQPESAESKLLSELAVQESQYRGPGTVAKPVTPTAAAATRTGVVDESAETVHGESAPPASHASGEADDSPVAAGRPRRPAWLLLFLLFAIMFGVAMVAGVIFLWR